jgi:hypothetical protein
MRWKQLEEVNKRQSQGGEAEDTKPDVIEDDGQMCFKDVCRRVSHDEEGRNCDARSLIAFDSDGGNLKSLTRCNCQETAGPWLFQRRF